MAPLSLTAALESPVCLSLRLTALFQPQTPLHLAVSPPRLLVPTAAVLAVIREVSLSRPPDLTRTTRLPP
jgi:hypothetical protein